MVSITSIATWCGGLEVVPRVSWYTLGIIICIGNSTGVLDTVEKRNPAKEVKLSKTQNYIHTIFEDLSGHSILSWEKEVGLLDPSTYLQDHA